MKVINFRLHLSLGTDPIPEPELEGEEGEREEEEEENENNGEDKEETTGDKRTGEDGKTAEELKAAEAAMEIPLTGQSQDEESLQRHRDSASTLGQSSSLNGALSQSVELHNVSPESQGASVVEEAEGRTREEEMEEVRGCVCVLGGGSTQKGLHLFSLPHSLLIVHCIPYMKSQSLQSTWILLNGKHIPCTLSTSAVGGVVSSPRCAIV